MKQFHENGNNFITRSNFSGLSSGEIVDSCV